MMKNKKLNDDNIAGGQAACLPEEQLNVAASATATDNSLGKFQSVEELLKAYNRLEAQFTKRSQELKRLEGQLNKYGINEQTCNAVTQAEAAKDETGSVAEVPGGNLQVSDCRFGSEEEIAAEVAEFFKNHPEAMEYAQAIAAKTSCYESVGSGVLERAYADVLYELLAKERERMLDAGYIYGKATELGSVKERIIREYLEEVRNSRPKAILLSGGTSVCTPPKRPKSLAEAGIMANDLLIKK